MKLSISVVLIWTSVFASESIGIKTGRHNLSTCFFTTYSADLNYRVSSTYTIWNILYISVKFMKLFKVLYLWVFLRHLLTIYYLRNKVSIQIYRLSLWIFCFVSNCGCSVYSRVVYQPSPLHTSKRGHCLRCEKRICVHYTRNQFQHVNVKNDTI